MDKANISYYEQSRNDKEKVKKYRDKRKYKYACIVYRQEPFFLLKNIIENNTDVFKIYLFENLQKKKEFLKLRSYLFEDKILKFAKLDKNKIIYDM